MWYRWLVFDVFFVFFEIRLHCSLKRLAQTTDAASHQVCCRSRFTLMVEILGTLHKCAVHTHELERVSVVLGVCVVWFCVPEFAYRPMWCGTYFAYHQSIAYDALLHLVSISNTLRLSQHISDRSSIQLYSFHRNYFVYESSYVWRHFGFYITKMIPINWSTHENKSAIFVVRRIDIWFRQIK